MYKNNRLKQIQSFLELHGSVDISALSRELGVSEMTIRRDLSILVSRGTAVRTHGGAILPRERYLGDVYMDSRSQINVAEKRPLLKLPSRNYSRVTLYISTTAQPLLP